MTLIEHVKKAVHIAIAIKSVAYNFTSTSLDDECSRLVLEAKEVLKEKNQAANFTVKAEITSGHHSITRYKLSISPV